MRKENRVAVNILKSMEDGIKEAINKIGTCEPKDIESTFEEIFTNPKLEKSSERLQKLMDNVRAKEERKRHKKQNNILEIVEYIKNCDKMTKTKGDFVHDLEKYNLEDILDAHKIIKAEKEGSNG